MARKRRKKSGNWITRSVFQPKLLFALSMICLITIMAPHYWKFIPDLSENKEYQIPSSSIEFTNPPEWIPEEFLDQVIKQGNLPENISLLNGEIVKEVALAFRKHPWIKNVRRVRKKTGTITVEVEYRKPVALVQLKDGYYPIDSTGILLPPADFTMKDTQNFPVIQGISSVPQGPAGLPWGDKLVSFSASLAHVILPDWKDFHFKTIRIPKQKKPLEKLDDLQFELITQNGSRILWGRGPLSNHPGELPVAKKIERLKDYQHDHGSFDDSRVSYIIDIRHWQSITRKPIMISKKKKKNRRS